jgi:hypothetical protein
MSGAAAVAEDANFFAKVFCINNAEMALYSMGSAYTALSQIPAYSRGGGPGPAPAAGFNPNGGTQGNIDLVSLASPEETEVMEGQNKKGVYAADFELSADGPLLLQSADLHVDESSLPGSTKPWVFFDEVCVFLGGTQLACEDADTSTDWSDIGSGEYRIRFSGLSGVLVSDDTTQLEFKVSVKDVIDSGDLTGGADWDIWLGDYRYLDESGLTQTDDFGTTDMFTVSEAEVASIDVRDATDEVDAFTIEVSDSGTTNGVAIYKFTIEEQNDVAIDIEDLSIDFFTSDVVTDVFAKARIKEGATQKGSDETVGATTLFNDVNIHLNGDQKKEFTLEVDLKDADNYAEGTTISADVVVTDLAAMDENGNDEDEITTSFVATSNTHTLRTTGVNVELVSVSDAVSGDLPNVGTYTIKVKVSSFGDDIYVADGCSDGGASFSWNIVGTASGSNACTLTSTGNDEGMSFLVQDGTSETFTLVVALNANDDFAAVELESLDWGLSDATSTANTEELVAADYRTDSNYLDY